MQSRATTPHSRAALTLGLLLAAWGASAEEQASPPASEPVLSLEQLMKLPSSAPVEASIERRGGSTKAEWQARFRSVRKDMAEADSELEAVRDQLEEEVGEGGSWKMSAPGLGSAQDPTDAPSNYRLSQELKRKREESQRARQALLDLEVEANLAGVPEDWRKDTPVR